MLVVWTSGKKLNHLLSTLLFMNKTVGRAHFAFNLALEEIFAVAEAVVAAKHVRLGWNYMLKCALSHIL